MSSRVSSGILPIIATLAIAVGLAPERPRAADARLPTHVRVRSGGRIIETPIEEYVLGSALAEVSPVGETTETVQRIFEVQAIVARTYAVAHLGRHRAEGFDLCDTTHCQLYDPRRIATSRFAAIARAAVRHTAGEIMTFDGRPIDALFHADCGGETAAADEVWGGPRVPYLVSLADDVPIETHRTWHATFSAAALGLALEADPEADVGARVEAIAIARRDESGRAAEIEVRGERTRRLAGDDFRRIVDAALGDHALLSTKFTVLRAGSSFEFDGAGYGHGVGLCQVGAAARARRGDSVGQILAAYYPGVTVQK